MNQSPILYHWMKMNHNKLYFRSIECIPDGLDIHLVIFLLLWLMSAYGFGAFFFHTLYKNDGKTLFDIFYIKKGSIFPSKLSIIFIIKNKNSYIL